MKTIYIKCEVPDYTNIDKFIAYLHELFEGKYEQLTTIDQEIQEAINRYEASQISNYKAQKR